MTHYLDIHGNAHERPAGAPLSWRVAGYGVIERDGLLLLVEPVWASGWRWNLPGGGVHLDPEESVLDGITREVFEETGYGFEPDAPTLAYLDDLFFRTPRGRFLHSVTFTVDGEISDEPVAGWVPPEDEIVHVAWVDPSTLRKDNVQWFHWYALVKLGYVTEEA